MTDMNNVCVVKVHRDMKNDWKDQGMMNSRKRTRKLSLSTRRYSRRAAWRNRRKRLAALQKVSEPSTSNEHRNTPENIIHLPFDEKTVQKIKCENHETDNVKEWPNVRTNNVEGWSNGQTGNKADWSNVQTGNGADWPRVETANEEFAVVKTENEEFVIEDTIIDQPDNQSWVLSIVDMQHIFAEFKAIGDHARYKGDCGIRHLQITGVKRLGLRTSISVICGMCLYTAEIHSAPDEDNEVHR